MNPILNYDFGTMLNCIANLPEDDKSKFVLKDELDRFFKDITCYEVKYTENTDKEFFGITVRPSLPDPEIMIDPDKECRAQRYGLEIDSKLYNYLEPREAMALILYEINTIVSKEAVEKFRNLFAYYLGQNGMVINVDNVKSYPNVFNMVAEETIRIASSAIDVPTGDVIVANDFISSLGLAETFNSAIDKINKAKSSLFVDELQPNLLVLQWYLHIVDDLPNITRSVVYTLRKSMDYIASKLINVSIVKAINELEPMTDDAERRYRSLTESTKVKKKSLFKQMKFDGLRSLEEDVYEYSMRVKNIETENDAILLMRQINSRLQILEDYLLNEELEERDKKRWENVLDKYSKLRDELARKTVYKQKMYGLFVDYNALQQMYDNGGFNVL